ncbi:protein transport Sec1a [Tripterygium wilfordii]|uniref:Protein transport Sec1a n=1 Tax=Tripterygium wilfordii TaxID=458696 RepID=A0A7J7CFJ0_TRIWF|nr:protein transport Sec1a [Tripterygium wilfordii]
MSFSDSESSSHGGSGEYKFFRQTCRDRLLYEMLGSSNAPNSKSWKVLIMDKVTVKVMSHSCKMADITDQGVSLVEDLFRRREPMPSMDVIYFIQPSKENVVMFLSDMSGREPLYKKAFVFFSSSVPKELVNHIKCDTSVLPRIGALREMNLEYFPIDNQAFITDHERALEDLYGEDVEKSRKFDACLNTMATRIATVFASLKELPFVRYRIAKSDDCKASSRDLVPTKLASAIWNCLLKYKAIPNFPQTETCELLILDRSVDQIAPVIHEWTYDAMCHDLLDMDGNKYVLEVPSKTGGQPEKKEVLLEDHDPVWLELRHSHIADASERLHDKMTNFVSNNKAAQMQQKARDGGELSTRDLQKIVQALPKYGEQVDKLSLHVEIAGRVNKIIRDTGLRELGQLEQDLVFGDAGAKDVINFLRTKQDASPEYKLRLLMIYACVYPEKFEGDKGTKLMQLAKLSREDMKVVENMKLLAGSSETKKASSGSFSLKFDGAKTKQAARKDRTGEEETWQLFRFYPMIEELIENLNKGALPKNEYACVNDPSPTAQAATTSGSVRSRQAPAAPERKTPAHSMRSRRTSTWARPNHSDDGYSSDSALKSVSLDFKKMGQRIFIFIIGGATRSEVNFHKKIASRFKAEDLDFTFEDHCCLMALVDAVASCEFVTSSPKA